MTTDELLSQLAGKRVIAIDGRSGAGKTTLSQILSERLGASVVHMDDFFLPLSLRSDKRLSEAGGNVHYERFIEEVLPHINDGKSFAYRRFDCSAMDYSPELVHVDRKTVIVEGAYSMHPLFGRYYDVSIFCDISQNEQIERIERRSGKTKAEIFRNKWIPLEEKYISAFSIMDKADAVIGCHLSLQ